MSPYLLPIIRIKNKDGSNRVCIDFRKFNKISEVDPEPLTVAEDLFQQLSANKYSSKIDLTNIDGQYEPEDGNKTEFMTPDGQYEFLRMSF